MKQLSSKFAFVKIPLKCIVHQSLSITSEAMMGDTPVDVLSTSSSSGKSASEKHAARRERKKEKKLLEAELEVANSGNKSVSFTTSGSRKSSHLVPAVTDLGTKRKKVKKHAEEESAAVCSGDKTVSYTKADGSTNTHIVVPPTVQILRDTFEDLAGKKLTVQEERLFTGRC